MESDLFFSSPRWKILEVLTTNPSSPLEISRKINTSIAYVSQQLKLLEVANLIIKEKTGLSDKGKPRNLYSITKEVLYLTVLIRGHPAKKILYLNNRHKLILNIWLLENPELHYYIEKLYWKIEESLNDIKSIFLDNSSKPHVIIVTESRTLKSSISSYLRQINNSLECSIISESEFSRKSRRGLYSIYDPNLLLENNMKEAISK